MNFRFLVLYLWNKIFWFFGGPIRTTYRFFVRPSIRAVKVTILRDDRTLLVRPNYGHRLWTFPGGAVDGPESYEDAAHCEVREETNLRLSSLKYIGENQKIYDYANLTTRIFIADLASNDFLVDCIEIKEASWFPLDTLPSNRAANVDKIIKVYKSSIPTA